MDQRSFLQAIIEDPDDDGPRLIFADWLEEQGNPRGEFIRVQCELERLGEDDPRRLQLETRQCVLLAEHQNEWAGALREFVHRFWFRRGFIDKVQIGAGQFLANAELLFETTPLSQVAFHNASQSLAQLADCPYLARLRGLDFKPDFTWRQRDFPSSQIFDEGVRILATSPHLANLRALDLGWNRIGDDGVRALAESPHLAGLVSLDLSQNEIGNAGLRALLLSSSLQNLKSLFLGENALSDVAIRPLGPMVANSLTTLHLESNQFDELSIVAIRMNFKKLAALKLDGNACGLHGAQALANLAELRSLSLNSTQFGDEGVQTIARSEMASLTKLYLRYNQISAEGAKALGNSKTFSNLALLDLRQNSIGDPGARAIAESAYLQQLTRLDLGENAIGDVGAHALAQSPSLTNLIELRLGQNPISAAGREALQARFGHRLIID